MIEDNEKLKQKRIESVYQDKLYNYAFRSQKPNTK